MISPDAAHLVSLYNTIARYRAALVQIADPTALLAAIAQLRGVPLEMVTEHVWVNDARLLRQIARQALEEEETR